MPVPPSLLQTDRRVICNEHELGVLLGRPVAVGDEVAAARALRDASGADQIVVVTLGERGALAVSGDEVLEQPAFDVSVVDSTGAGDAFVGGFLNGRWWQTGIGRGSALGLRGGRPGDDAARRATVHAVVDAQSRRCWSTSRRSAARPARPARPARTAAAGVADRRARR